MGRRAPVAELQRERGSRVATEYKETISEDDDLEGRILQEMAGGARAEYAFIVATDSEDGEGFNLRVATGITDVTVLRRLLEKTLDALP